MDLAREIIPQWKEVRMTWLEWLKDMTEKVPAKYLGPIGEMDPGDREIGIVDEAIRPIFAVSRQLNSLCEKLALGHIPIHYGDEEEDKEACKAVINELEMLDHQEKAVREVFWASLRHQLSFFRGNIGVRGDWRAVTFDIPEEKADQRPYMVILGIPVPQGFVPPILGEEKKPRGN